MAVLVGLVHDLDLIAWLQFVELDARRAFGPLEGPVAHGKPVGINLFLGKRPYAAFGNSAGDIKNDWKTVFAKP